MNNSKYNAEGKIEGGRGICTVCTNCHIRHELPQPAHIGWQQHELPLNGHSLHDLPHALRVARLH
jgi:hypothetical protein